MRKVLLGTRQQLSLVLPVPPVLPTPGAGAMLGAAPCPRALPRRSAAPDGPRPCGDGGRFPGHSSRGSAGADGCRGAGRASPGAGRDPGGGSAELAARL